VLDKKEVSSLPIPEFSDHQIQELSALYVELAKQERAQAEPIFQENTGVKIIPDIVKDKLGESCDKKVENVFGIPGSVRLLAEDFWNVRYLLNKGKSVGKPEREPSSSELRKYATCLAKELDEFANARHRVQINKLYDLIACSIEITNSKTPFKPEIKEQNSYCIKGDVGLGKLLRQQYSQWIYIRRGLRIFEGPRVHLFKSPRLIDWTETQALLDSDEIIGDILAHRRITT
jgi:hypothetical protein